MVLISDKFSLTGSTLYNASGTDSGKGCFSEYGRVYEGKEKTFHPTVIKALHHGNIQEIDAIAILIYKIMPAYFPDLSFEEVVSFVLPDYLIQYSQEDDGKCISSKDPVPLCIIARDGVLTKRWRSSLCGGNQVPLLQKQTSCYHSTKVLATI